MSFFGISFLILLNAPGACASLQNCNLHIGDSNTKPNQPSFYWSSSLSSKPDSHVDEDPCFQECWGKALVGVGILLLVCSALTCRLWYEDGEEEDAKAEWLNNKNKPLQYNSIVWKKYYNQENILE